MTTVPESKGPVIDGTQEVTVDIKAFQVGPTPFALQMVEGPGAPYTFLLTHAEEVVGRSEEADIRVDTADLSRRHLLLRREHGQYTVLDLESRNGVYLNGVRIHSAVLHEGDNLQLGSVVLIFREGRE